VRDDHAIHGAAAAGEVDAVRRWLDADPALAWALRHDLPDIAAYLRTRGARE